MRGAVTGMTTLSTKLRWLLARITPPWSGTFSWPVTLGRQTALTNGSTTLCITW